MSGVIWALGYGHFLFFYDCFLFYTTIYIYFTIGSYTLCMFPGMLEINLNAKDDLQTWRYELWLPLTGARSWTGPALASEGQGQGHYVCGPDMEGWGQVQQKSPGPGPDRPSDSLAETRFEIVGEENTVRPMRPVFHPFNSWK